MEWIKAVLSSLMVSRRRVPRSRSLAALAPLAAWLLAAGPAAGEVIATRELDPGPEKYPVAGYVAPLPGGGFVAAWSRGIRLSFGVDQVAPDRPFAAWLSPLAEPVAPSQALEGPDEEITRLVALASTAPGETLALVIGAVEDELIVFSRRFFLDGRRGPLRPLEPCPGLPASDLAAGGSGYWWTCGDRLQRLDRAGHAVGEAVALAGPEAEATGSRVSDAPGGGAWVVWSQLVGAQRRIVARRFDASGSPSTALIAVSPPSTLVGELSPDLAALPGGGALVAWSTETGRVLLRRLGPDGELLSSAMPATAEPGPPEHGPRVAVSAEGLAAVGWTRGSGFPAPDLGLFRVFDAGGAPAGEEHRLDVGRLSDLAFGERGRLLVLGHETVPIEFNVYLRPRIGVVPVASLVPPPGPGFTSAELPGFRFWVRIGGDEPEPRIGAPEPLCIPETACVSGALPGRTEVLLRIVGPKPNGYLWPNVVRFTTSAVEVWIEQLATGERRYYLLEGASPGSSELDGFFDRTGFLPP